MSYPPSTKVCSKCKVEKNTSEFHKNRSRDDGLQHYCKMCQSFMQKVYYNPENSKAYYLANRDRINAVRRAYVARNKEKISERHKAYYIANRDKLIDQVKTYNATNKDRKKEYAKEYVKTEKGASSRRKANSKARPRRRALKRGANIESFSPIEIFERDGYICQLCGIKTRPDFKSQYHPKRPELDHIIPLSIGGDHSMVNTQCLCRHCNITKSNSGKGDQLRLFG
jgi:5-methylcytosine-specific restriction endonuclease McrA